MIPASNDDDEPDVIDLTTFYGYRGSLDFPLRPPSPFADTHAENRILSQHNEDTDTHGTVIWSSPVKPQSLSFKINNTENPVLSSSSQPSSSASVTRANSIWRRTFRKLLKRTKSVERKKSVRSTACEYTHRYNFGTGEINRRDSLISRTSSHKRVHWFDDDEIILNACHRFVEYLKLLVENILDDKNENNYLENCQLSLNELESLINYQQIQQAFKDIIKSIKRRDRNQLMELQTYIENLVSRNLISSFA